MNPRLLYLINALFGPTIICSTPSFAASQAVPPGLDEQGYVQEVLRAGLAARVADAEAALGQAERVGAGALPNPTLAWQRESVATGAVPGTTQDILSVSLPLVLSGRLGLEREAALRTGEAALARRSRARAELRYEAIRRFYAAVAATEKKAVLAESLTKLRQLADLIVAREKAGDASGYDRVRIGLEAASIADLLRGAVLAERAAKAAALALLGPEHAFLPALLGSLAKVGGRTERRPMFEDIENRRADLRALKLEATADELARRAAGRSWIPEIAVHGGAQVLDVGRPGESRGYVAGIEIPLPLFARRQGDRARAQARRELAEARRAALLREAKARLAAVLVEADERRARAETHRTEVLARAEELRKIATAAYRGGASDLLALVDAERAAREARLQAVDLATAVVDIDNDLLLLAGSYDQAETRSRKP
jgi:cobalt-zinc-cadmium efflux system outer membrane protein